MPLPEDPEERRAYLSEMGRRGAAQRTANREAGQMPRKPTGRRPGRPRKGEAAPPDLAGGPEAQAADPTSLPPQERPEGKPGAGKRVKGGTATIEECTQFIGTLYALASIVTGPTRYTPPDDQIAAQGRHLYRTIQMVPILAWLIRGVSPISLLVGLVTNMARMAASRTGNSRAQEAAQQQAAMYPDPPAPPPAEPEPPQEAPQAADPAVRRFYPNGVTLADAAAVAGAGYRRRAQGA